MKSGITPDASLADVFIGNVGGCVGEVSAIALLIGGIYLLAKGVIRIRIPAAYILTVAVLTLIFSRAPEGYNVFVWMLREIFSGGLMLGAFFMATDYVTSPNTAKGEIIFGIGAGLLVVFIRYFGGYPEGVCYSILIMNICVWLIDKAGMPNRFGVTKEMRQAAKAQAKAAKKAAKEGSEA
jgi:electron transport complex protein RnfD